MVTVKTCNTRLEAEVVKGFLNSHNIKALILADDEGGVQPYPFMTTNGVRIVVNENDEQRATEILQHEK